jgi:hypothetical protein
VNNSIDFDAVRQRISLLRYCEQRGIKLRRSGSSWIGRCPIHQEQSGASFVIWGERRWSCFGKCGRGGDVIDLERALGGGSVREAIERLSGSLSPLVLPRAEPKARKQAGSWPWPEQLRLGSKEEHEHLAADRRISANACRLAEARGLLRFLGTREGAAWVVTDRIRENAVARLVSGQLWSNGAKAKTLPDSRAKRPIGILEAMDFGKVAIIEGGPDTLAAFHFMLECGTESEVAPVCMTSTNADFLPGDLARLRGKVLRLFPHADPQGYNAALRWLKQLRPISADIDIADLGGLIKSDGAGAKDLNDLTALADDGWEPLREDLDNLMVFEGRHRNVDVQRAR